MIVIKPFSANNDDDNANAKISLIAAIPAIASNPADILRKSRAVLIHPQDKVVRGDLRIVENDDVFVCALNMDCATAGCCFCRLRRI